ncbi:hypothetical protein [Pseudomonas alkylphenolica]|uniref:hypothetical protein n=1 Tax=Pseudomonas alkylphenolica TaxID=237609 RepID=UPI000FEC01F4|nr:hypothetical protein [Pseudomonas alkylphenolica]
MIDINTWPPIIVIPFGLAPFVIVLSGIALNAYTARSRDFDLIIASLPNSLWLKQQIPFWGTSSLKSRCYLLSSISGAMLYPKFCIRLGMMDAEDLRNFPQRLRRRIQLICWLVMIGSAWFAIGLALIQLSPTR